jgi:hypothetical protein
METMMAPKGVQALVHEDKHITPSLWKLLF